MKEQPNVKTGEYLKMVDTQSDVPPFTRLVPTSIEQKRNLSNKTRVLDILESMSYKIYTTGKRIRR